MNTNSIEKHVELKAPVSRVWRALTNHIEFGKWFGVKMAGPFIVGTARKGRITHPGFEKLKLEVVVKKMVPEKLFSYTWHPYAMDPKLDYSEETPTLVVFRLKGIPAGTLLTVKETGFDRIPAGRRAEAFRMHSGGWAEQMKNIKRYVAKA